VAKKGAIGPIFEGDMPHKKWPQNTIIAGELLDKWARQGPSGSMCEYLII
jgi:hypothetical protein